MIIEILTWKTKLISVLQNYSKKKKRGLAAWKVCAYKQFKPCLSKTHSEAGIEIHVLELIFPQLAHKLHFYPASLKQSIDKDSMRYMKTKYKKTHLKYTYLHFSIEFVS